MWTNWSGGLECRPRATVRPLDEAGVSAAVRRAAERGVQIRPVGAGHSFTPLAVTEDVQLDLSALTGLVAAGTDRVRVRAGTTLRELNLTLAGRGVALATLGDIDAQTVAGAVSTGTHGSGAGLGSLSSLVTGGRLVEGRGRVRDIQPEELDAIRTGLGALGVLTEVELAVVPGFVLQAGEATRPLEEVLDAEFLDGHRWAEFFVFPYASEAIARWADEVDSGPEPQSGVRRFVEQTLVRNVAFGGGVALGRTMPRLVPTINRVATRLNGSTTVTDVSYRVLVTPRRVRFEESEWALPRDALAAAVPELLTAIADRGLEVGFPLEVRVGAAETGWLHPAYGRPTGWIAVHAAKGTDHRPLMRLAAAVLAAHGGRPHWGKRHEWTATEVSAAYPRFPDFRRVRDELDPDRVFTNPHLEQLLGP